MKSTLFACILIFFTLSADALEPEEQVLEVATINGNVLSDPLVAYSNGKDTYLPLLDTARVLGVQVEQPENAVFKVFQNETDFEIIDLTKCSQSNCPPYIEKKGIYFIDSTYLREHLLWPLSVDFKTMQLIVNIDSSRKETHVKKGDDDDAPYVIQRRKYGAPSFRAETTLSSVPENSILNLYETQPLFQNDSDLLVSKTSQQTNVRWTLSKEIVESKDPYELKNYELVSTQTIDTKYLFLPTQVTGIYFSNIKSGESIFDTQNLYEKGPPRWKVDLFVNEIYMGETYIDLNGNFSFLNIPIFYGQNNIRYKLTSPIGKTLEVERTLNVSTDFQGRGKFKYQAAFGQIVNDSNIIGSGFVNYGLSTYVSTQLGYAQFRMPNDTQDKRYSLVGVSYLQPAYSLTLSRLNALSGQEHAWVFSPKANVGKMLLSGEYASFQEFHTLLINTYTNDEMSSLKKLSLLLPLQTENPVILQVSALESTYLNMNSNQQVQAKAYTLFSSSSLLLESNKFWPSQANPDLYVEYGNYSSAFRIKYGVLVQNDLYAKSKGDIEYLLKNNFFLTLSADVPPNSSEGSYVFGISKVLGDIQTEMNVVRSAKEVVYNLTLSTNIKPAENGYRFTQDEAYRQAGIELFAFVDENSNGVYDLGEKPYHRLRIVETHRQKEYETDEQGIAQILSLNPYQRITLQVVKESIPNIFLTATDFQNDFILTPAQLLRVELPIKPTFDTRGQIQNSYYKKLVPLEIVDHEGKLIGTTLSNSSGKYKFSDLPGGTYFIRISPKFLIENKLAATPAEIAIDLSGKPGLRTASEMILEKK